MSVTNPEPEITTVDAFLGGLFQLEQPRRGPRAGIDAMLLAASVPCHTECGERVLDAGSGSGAIALSIASRFPHAEVIAVEKQPAMASLARRNAARNGLQERLRVIEADLMQPLRELAALGLEPRSFDHVVANPPYYHRQRSRPCRSDDKSAAHRQEAGDLAAWLTFLTNMAAPKATLSLIHLPERLPELLQLIGKRFGAMKLAPIHARADEPAIRIVIEGVKGSRTPLQLRPALVLQDEAGSYLPAVDAILRHGAGWHL